VDLLFLISGNVWIRLEASHQVSQPGTNLILMGQPRTLFRLFSSFRTHTL